jgi:hypothetical protein
MMIKISGRSYGVVVIVAWCFYNHHISSLTHLPLIELVVTTMPCNAFSPIHDPAK